jgi:hypothetical protein
MKTVAQIADRKKLLWGRSFIDAVWTCPPMQMMAGESVCTGYSQGRDYVGENIMAL